MKVNSRQIAETELDASVLEPPLLGKEDKPSFS